MPWAKLLSKRGVIGASNIFQRDPYAVNFPANELHGGFAMPRLISLICAVALTASGAYFAYLELRKPDPRDTLRTTNTGVVSQIWTLAGASSPD
jgi:hypothetical protein